MTLYLLPNLLGPSEPASDFLPPSVYRAVSKIDGLIAESEGEGRRFLKRFQTKKEPHNMPIALLNETIDFLIEPLLKGECWGLVSDAGLPCLADPGALLVQAAKQKKVVVEAFVGPSSITLALMQSGLSGQHFVFHGYLPKTAEERCEKLQSWQKMRGYTHIFIEAPYRNEHTFQSCLETLSPQILFSVATHLTLPDQFIYTAPISHWRKLPPPNIAKRPTIFLFHAT